jgi:hypothetical protein
MAMPMALSQQVVFPHIFHFTLRGFPFFCFFHAARFFVFHFALILQTCCLSIISSHFILFYIMFFTGLLSLLFVVAAVQGAPVKK